MYFNAQETRIPGLETTSHGWVSTYPLSQNAGRVTRGSRLFARQDCVRVSLRGAIPGTQYQVAVNETVVSEDALGTAASLSGISIPSSPSTNQDSPTTDNMMMAMLPEVSSAESKAQQLSDLSTSLDKTFEPLRKGSVANSRMTTSGSLSCPNSTQRCQIGCE